MKTNSTRRGGASTALTGKGILRVSLALLTAAALLTGCGKDDPDPEPKPKPEPEPEATLSISPVVETLTFSAENPETHTFEVTTNQSEWKALSDQDWCRITTDSEKGTFSVTALPNPTTKAPTPATITVSAGKAAPLEIAATQLPVIYDVYLAGAYQPVNQREVVCYWKNGVRKGLTDPMKYSFCFSCTASDNSFYIAGVGDGTDCYWKDGEKVVVTNLSPVDIAVEKGKVFLLDNMNRYWIDGEVGSTPSPVQGFTAKYIAASEGTPYVAGRVSITLFGNTTNMAYIWKPGENAVELPEPGSSNDSDVTCIVASGGSIYVGGFYFDKATNIQHACYWKDKVCTVLGLPQGTTSTSAAVDAICVVDETVYAAGSYTAADGKKACYWVNGTCKKLELPGDNNIHEIAGIAVADGKVYVAGNYFGNSNTRVGYWFDGTWNEMDQEAGVSDMTVYGIAVLKK